MKTIQTDFFDIQVKSKERVQIFGEVFTPEKYVEQMLDMIDKKVCSDENQVFFEPTCGHGNFVVSILNRRLNFLYKKAKRKKVKSPELWTVANAINALWAIDIDSENVNETRFRVITEILSFITSKTNTNIVSVMKKNEDFFTHIFCAVDYQIHQNEIITSLQKDKEKAKKESLQTKVSEIWFEKGNHNFIDFNMNWVEFYKRNKPNILFKRKSKFIKGLLRKKNEINFSQELSRNFI